MDALAKVAECPLQNGRKGRFSYLLLLLVAACPLKASSGIPVSGSRRMIAVSCYADRLLFYLSLDVKFIPEMYLEILGGR